MSLEKNDEYRNKLLHPKWQKKRLEIFQRDNFTCQLCDSKDITLTIHHRYYKNCEPWEYPDDALLTVCEICHNTEHLVGANLSKEDLINIIRDKPLFIKMVAQLSVLIEEEPLFQSYLRDFLSAQIASYYSNRKTNG